MASWLPKDMQHAVMPLQVLRNEEIFTDPNSSVNGASSATDGDLDAAYAMLLAGQKWHEPLYTDRGIKVGPSCLCTCTFVHCLLFLQGSASTSIKLLPYLLGSYLLLPGYL